MFGFGDKRKAAELQATLERERLSAMERQELFAFVERLQEKQTEVLTSVMQGIDSMSAASVKQQEVLLHWFKQFEINTPPEVRTFSDEDAWLREAEGHGYPVNGSLEEQATWVLTQSGSI